MIKKHLPISEHQRWCQSEHKFGQAVLKIVGVEATLCFIGLAWSCSEMLLIVRQWCGRTFASWQLDGAAVDASLQSIYLPFWHAILCGISKSMSFSQAKDLWSEVMSLIFPDPKRCNTATCFIICCIPQLATFRVSLISLDLSWLPGCQPGIQPRPNSWASVCCLAARQRPSLVVKLRIATEYILMHAATCCNVLQRAATVSPPVELNSLTRFACVLHIFMYTRCYEI